MKFSITIDGQEHTLELMRENGLRCRLDGSPFAANAAEVEPGVYSLVIGEGGGGKSFKVRVAPEVGNSSGGGNTGDYRVETSGAHYRVSVEDPRRRPRQGEAKPALEGQQNIMARMPGKVVRILVSEGQAVQRGQGLIVVEAMKMQNEIKCPTSGKIQKVLVREGQAVNTGESMLVVE